jgi:hypothetical protein
MSLFTFSCRWVLNARAPVGSRFNAFIRCCSAFGRLALLPGGMQVVYDRLGLELGFDGDNKPSPDQMTEGVGMLVAARSRLHHERRLYEAKCRSAKRAGGRHRGGPYDGVEPLGLLRRARSGGHPNRSGPRRPRVPAPPPPSPE